MFRISTSHKKYDFEIPMYCQILMALLWAFPNNGLSVSPNGIEPAGDLPHLGEGSGLKLAAKLKQADQLNTATTGNMGDEVRPSSDVLEASWDSFNEASGKGVAAEITKGVRVEDIVEPPAEYHFASFGKQDPFIPPLLPTTTKPGETSATAGSLEVPIVSALQRYSLDSLLVVGIWQLSNGDRKAMVLTPPGESGGGQGIIVKAGDPIGNRGGRILAIGSEFLTVREFYLAPDGTRQFEDRRLPMTVTPADQRPARLVFKPGEIKPKQVFEGEELELGTGSEGKRPNDAGGKKAGMIQVQPARDGSPGDEANPMPGNMRPGSQTAPIEKNGSNPKSKMPSTNNPASSIGDSPTTEEISTPAGDLSSSLIPILSNSSPGSSSTTPQSGRTPNVTIPE